MTQTPMQPIPTRPGQAQTQTGAAPGGPQEPQRYIPGPRDFMSPGSGESVDSVGNQSATPGQAAVGALAALGMGLGPALGMAMSPLAMASLMNTVVDPFGHKSDMANYVNYAEGMNAAEGMSGMGGMSTGSNEPQAGGFGFAGGEDGTGVGYAAGGSLARYAGGGALTQSGLIAGGTPGRADAVVARPESNGYIIPADVVSALGDGNTEAGALSLAQRLGSSPGQAMMDGGNVPARVAHGEYYLSPPDAEKNGGKGALDQLVNKTRANYAKKLKKLPGPK